jgi:hypothetical protein
MNFARTFRLYNKVTEEWVPRPGRREFEQRRLVIAPGAEQRTAADEWSDALVAIESGLLEVECLSGARWTFGTSALLCLSWLPVQILRNPGASPVVLVATRRRRLLLEVR